MFLFFFIINYSMAILVSLVYIHSVSRFESSNVLTGKSLADQILYTSLFTVLPQVEIRESIDEFATILF